MLNGTRDTRSDVQIWCDDLTCLTNLVFIWYKTRIYGSTTSTTSITATLTSCTSMTIATGTKTTIP